MGLFFMEKICNNFEENKTNFKNFKMKKKIKNFNIDIRNLKKLKKTIQSVK